METHDFKVGDKVIINPDIPVGEKMPILDGKDLKMLKNMRRPGVFTVKIACTECIKLNNSFGYGPTGLLHAPMYEVGNYVMISKESPYKGWVGIIESIEPFVYTPNSMGEDGCHYCIKLNEGNVFCCHNNDFELITSPNKLIYQQENENQLQRKEVAVSRGDKLTGSSICCRRCKASITVGHLSYKKISGS